MKSSFSFEISENPVLGKTLQEFRVLIRAPSINDASVTVKILRSAGINGIACTNVEQVDEEIRRGCAMLIVAEEALIRDIAKLTDILVRQPPWSDLPIVIVTSGGEFANRQEGLQNLVRSGNIAEIERPFRPETLLSTVRVALRARQRQYEMRDLLQKMQNGEARIRQILESISDAFISIDTDWRIRFVNSAYMALVSSLFRAPEELVGHDFREKISDLGDSSTRDFYRRVMKQQRPESIEIYYTPLQAWLEIRAFPSPEFLSLYVRNITERRDAENNLRAAKESAEAANRSKDVFLAMLSHELRTPLTPILMIATSRERDGTIAPNLRIEMGVISRNVALETKLIDDLLDLSRITSGKVVLDRQAVDFNGSVKQVCETCKTLIIDRGIDFTLSLAENAVHVDADPARLQQILWNILQNAIKFSPQGGKILVSTSYPSQSVVRCTIQDAGIGIDAELLPRIFNAFEQGDGRKREQLGGLGLGLAISKALVELHDGTIKAESEGSGRGSCFTIEFPISRCQSVLTSDIPSTSTWVGRLSVLLVEDHVDTSVVLKTILESLGFVVKVANSGHMALDTAIDFPFDILVSDIGLTDLSGYELIAELKKQYRFEAIAISGYGMETDLRKSRDAGFSEHLVKPVTFESIQQALQRLLQRRRTSS